MKLTKNKTPVMWISMLIVLLVIAYDAYAVAHKDKYDTVSKIITKSSEKYLLIPFIFGLLVGHFFWSQHFSRR